MAAKNSLYYRIFFHSLRTAIIFVMGLVIYEILLNLEKKWNINNPGNNTYYFRKRIILKFIFIFILDFMVLYLFYWGFNELL